MTTGSLCDRLSVKESRAELAAREKFRSRLMSFSTATYFAKPTSLSPTVCALLGWENVQTDLLVCSGCGAACSITFPSVLSTDSAAKLCSQYEAQLAKAHEEYCSFRVEAEAFQHQIKAPHSRTLPLALASVLPVQQLQLLEQKRPMHVFRDASDNLIHAIMGKMNDRLVLPAVKLPNNVDDFQCQDSQQSTTLPLPPLLDRIQTAIASKTQQSLPPNALTTAVALALFGWLTVLDVSNEQQEDDDASQLVICTECSMCLSRYCIYAVENDDNQDQHLKRPRTRSPLEAHAHYCPYITAMGPAHKEPLWQTLAGRLLTQTDERNVDETFLETHGTLRGLLSPKFRLHRDRLQGGSSAQPNGLTRAYE